MTEASTNLRVATYARVSSAEQVGHEHFSIAAQFNEMREYAVQRDWKVVTEFVDEGISGEKWDRPGFEAMLVMAQEEGFDVLLVHELSRLSRSLFHTLEIFDLLGQFGLGFASVKDPNFNFADPTQRLFLSILAAVNQYYLDILRMHIRKSKRQRAKAGLYNASSVPFGYRMVGGPKNPPVVVSEEVQAVELAFEQYAVGNTSHMEIANLLNTKGYHTSPSSRFPEGRRFSKDNISEMLRNPFYMGKVVYRIHSTGETEVYDGQHEAIVELELWERCQQARAKRRSSSRSVQKPYRVYLLSNMARCDVCQRNLRCQGASGKTYYREMSYERGYQDCPHTRAGTRTEPVDQYIHALIEAIQLPEDWLEDVSMQVNDDEDLNILNMQRKELEARRRRLKEMKIVGEFDEDADLYQSEMTRIRRELDSIPGYDELENLRAIVASIEDLSETWARAEPADQRDLLRLMFRKVIVDVPLKRVVAIVPQAIFIPILRQVPLLQERDLGVFVPVWSPEHTRREGKKQVITIPQLAPITILSERSTAAPFLLENPIAPPPKARIAPGLSRALALCKKSGLAPKTLVQAISPDRLSLPADLRKWPQATEEDLTIGEILDREQDSVDVLATQFLFWDNVLATLPENTDVLLKRVHTKLREKGVWYLQELLPTDMPAHWLYTYFPAAWQWARKNTWNLYTLYNQLRRADFTSQVKRYVYYQPVHLGDALEFAEQRLGNLVLLTDDDYKQGIFHLQQAVEEHGQEYLIGSEVALADVWTQKNKG